MAGMALLPDGHACRQKQWLVCRPGLSPGVMVLLQAVAHLMVMAPMDAGGGPAGDPMGDAMGSPDGAAMGGDPGGMAPLALMEQWQLWMVLRPQTWQKVWMPQMLAQKLLAAEADVPAEHVLTTSFKLTYIVRHQISCLVPEFSFRKINHAVRSPGSSNHCAKARCRAR